MGAERKAFAVIGERWKGQWWKDFTKEPGEGADEPLGVPVVRCPSCAGEGTTRQSSPTGHHPPEECSFCAGQGVVRAQLVISVVDLPTGRVASRSIVPGVLTPIRAANGQAVLDLAAVVREMAIDLDLRSIYRAPSRELAAWDQETPYFIPLRHAADADVSDEWRFEYEGAAIAREARTHPHVIFYAGVESKPTPSADDSLRRLVRTARDLQLDLVVDVRVERSEMLIWSVRLDVPGDAIPEKPSARFNTLHRALRETTVETTLDWLRNRSITVPARWLDISPVETRDGTEGWGSAQPDDLTWAEISARLTPLAVRGEGAVGVLRQGAWFFSSLAARPGRSGPRVDRGADPRDSLSEV
jgi:hypothetical protein